ncbi:hypothetical protein ONS95_011431 [Cadophora gregata]|uniref:uncharacterized protein n=1 Tax=Cadophora gregata TaxID=51156 RepID=UPI0026DC0558|nr:uncharacterized protein ONS95_011431 [Cadophora gregata]KAK0120013.1 hypothetical protein ONS95_011431 [Cadophora gregata]
MNSLQGSITRGKSEVFLFPDFEANFSVFLLVVTTRRSGCSNLELLAEPLGVVQKFLRRDNEHLQMVPWLIRAACSCVQLEARCKAGKGIDKSSRSAILQFS